MFFFSCFPNDHTEKDLWRIFQRFGKVNEVFIANKRNKRGQWFDFVRLLEVSNHKKLEYELDHIWIGDLKLHANIPRFKRDDGNQVHAEMKMRRIDFKGGMKAKIKGGTDARTIRRQDQTYAQAVLNPRNGETQNWEPKKDRCKKLKKRSGKAWRPLTKKQITDGYNNRWFGRCEPHKKS